jgi:hypothetical protein
MQLSLHDLKQIDESYLRSLSLETLLALTLKAFSDLNECHDRLNQNSTNSSTPPSTEKPWTKMDLKQDALNNSEEDPEDHLIDLDKEEESRGKAAQDKQRSAERAQESNSKTALPEDTPDRLPPPKKRPGKQKGAQGYGRTQKLPITSEVIHRAECCAACGVSFDGNTRFEAKTGHYVIDIVSNVNGLPGIQLTNTKHIYGDTYCHCGHITRIFPYKCEKEEGWNVDLTEWHLVGPQLVSLICCLSLRMRMSRTKIQEFLRDWLELSLSTGTIHQCILEAGRAVAPLEKELLDALRQESIVYGDETPWWEKGQFLWLWVFSSALTVYYAIGSRTAEMLESILGENFKGWLMSDGYRAYRRLLKRLRCWAHLERKAKGLSESLDKEAQAFGKKVLKILKTLQNAVYRAREGPYNDLMKEYDDLLFELKYLCLKNDDSSHEKTRALAREFLYDWDAIFMILSHPELSLTNNEAERMLRHWVIARRLSHGTRTQEGSMSFTLLASIIETCRKRKVKPWTYLTQVVQERRKGNVAPALPQVQSSRQVEGLLQAA